MNQEQMQAYEWAKNQNYQSVAARYAKILAGLVDEMAQTNEPLTLEQLREMDGEPVYLMPMKWWALVESPKGLKRVILRLSNGGWAALYSDEDLKYYTEAIYCRPPEGEEDTCREIPCDWPCGEGPVSEAN